MVNGLSRRSLFLTFLFLSFAVPLFADLDDFTETVQEEAEDEDDKEKEKEDEKSKWNDDEDGDDSESNGFFGAIFAVTGYLWYAHNATSWYPEYPYALAPDRPNAVGHDWALIDDDEYVKRKRSKLAVSMSGGAFFEGDDIGTTIAARVSGKLGGMFGPDLEYRLWTDPSATLHMLKVGGHLPLIQTDYFALDFNLAGAFFFDALNLAGTFVGGALAIYPFQPLSIELRGGGIFSSGGDFGEFAARVAIHARRWDLYGGYHGLYFAEMALHGLDLGASVHF